MCGFTVIFSYAPDAPPVNVGEVRQINERMRARGPDGEGEWFSPDGRVGLVIDDWPSLIPVKLGATYATRGQRWGTPICHYIQW